MSVDVRSSPGVVRLEATSSVRMPYRTAVLAQASSLLSGVEDSVDHVPETGNDFFRQTHEVADDLDR